MTARVDRSKSGCHNPKPETEVHVDALCSLLACSKQSAGRNRVWPLVFSVELAIVEAERAEEEAERLIHSLTISPEPARQDASEREAMASRHILPRITASATKSLREALEGFDRATEISRELEAFIRGRKIH